MNPPIKKETIDSLSAAVPAAPKKFFAELGKAVEAEDLEHFDKPLLEKMLSSHWELAKKRKNGDPRITVYHATAKGQRRTIVDVVSDDMAFLVDSIAAEINKNNYLIDLLLHPILYAQYSKSGELMAFSDKPQDGFIRQSHIHVHIANTLSDEALERLREGLITALEDVRICNRDWTTMLDRLQQARAELAVAETGMPRKDLERYCAFLDYLYNNNFTLIGYREYEFVENGNKLTSKTVKGKSLGLLHDDITPAYISESDEGLPRNLQELRRALPPVSVSKTNRLSTVHRRVPMDAVAIKSYDRNGKVKGEKLFLGLFTSVTYSRSVGDVPYLREKVEEVMAMSDFLPGSHNAKALRHILEKYPRDELFQIGNKELFEICLNILHLQERQRIALFVRRDQFGRYISCLVYIPRDRFGTTLRQQICEILEQELNGKCSNFSINVDDSVFARVMFTIDVSQKNPPKFEQKDLEIKIREIGQTWMERLSAALMESDINDNEIKRLTLKYGEAFPIAYTARYRARQAIFDIHKIEETLKTGRLNLDLYRLDEEESHLVRLKVYNPAKPLNLSDVLPILENMDLRAVAELPFEVRPGGENASIWIHDFLLEMPSPESARALNEAKPEFEESFTKIWYGEVENDALNKLVLRAGLGWREVMILRTYTRYKRQIGSPFSRTYIEAALSNNASISRILTEMFSRMHDPAEKGDRSILAADYMDKINNLLEKVESLDEDRILRNIALMMDATVRTNFYQRQDDGSPKNYLSIKLESGRIAALPEPKPFREIFVYSPRVEAVHLRADKIARGGIRWSDRHEDFRTEVLGLMKAQQVKNAVIVPMGAKGGFVVKTPIKDRKAFQAEGIECYRIMIRGMLDITDNLKGSRVAPPKDVVRLDADDPYLVVAADKGTASFSDIANALSREYGFWLDDAFASGGSAGYDHKGMGITARGAWEGIKLHFRQLNHNIQEQPFDVTGVGDMGGDVFGNGMLLSQHIRLVGAFNHVHIFCDPDPDTASSFKERKRLFEGVLGWDQYDVKKLSKGGRIYNRNEKTLVLTPEIQKRFDIAKEKVTPTELMRAILKARTDLLYFGGIGTYIKATKQAHTEVGDKANESIRIDAPEVRAKVIGEGANLAMTQLSRIEYAMNGGRVNTDFIDNSAGVDTSDHEVNIKILMAGIMSGKDASMTLASRNKLLESMTDDVAAHVLRDNYQQTLAISLAELQARENLKLHEEFIRKLERNNGLKRKLEGLPDDEEIAQRQRLGRGLTRPELCILLAYAKIIFTRDLLATPMPDTSEMQQWIVNYFPEALSKKYRKEIMGHKLGRELASMSLANSMVNRMGPGFVETCTNKIGVPADAIARAFLVVRESFGLRNLWNAIEALDNKIPAEVQLKALREIFWLAEHAVIWFLTRHGEELRVGPEIENYGGQIEKLRKILDKIATGEMKDNIEIRTQTGIRDGLPPDLAKSIAILPALHMACDITSISLKQKLDLEKAAQVYYEIGTRFHLDWLRQQAGYIATDNRWQAEATDGLIESLYTCQAGLAVHILHESKDAKSKSGLVDTWAKSRAGQVEQIERMFAELRQAGTIELPMLVIAEQRLRALYGG